MVYNKETGKFEDGFTFHSTNDVVAAAEAFLDSYRRMELNYKSVLEENKKLKEGIWKEEEMARLKKEYERMKADYNRGFPISEKEADAIRKFKDAHRQPFGVRGGGYTYIFVPTALGTAGTITAMNGDKFQFQEID